MTIAVKICGLKTEPALDAALDAGAAYVGLVFYPPSPRSLTPEGAKLLADRARGKARIVTLLVDPDDATLEAVVTLVEPDLIQLHGHESPERAAAIRKRWGRPTMKAISVADEKDARLALEYRRAADMILFDTKAPRELAGALPGGNGLTFDWRLLVGIKHGLPFMLSGGLTPANVAEAIRATGAQAVDVSSGVETQPGEKSAELIRQFISAAKQTRGGPTGTGRQ